MTDAQTGTLAATTNKTTTVLPSVYVNTCRYASSLISDPHILRLRQRVSNSATGKRVTKISLYEINLID